MFQAAGMVLQGYDLTVDHKSFFLVDRLSSGDSQGGGCVLVTDGGYAMDALIALREHLDRGHCSQAGLVDPRRPPKLLHLWPPQNPPPDGVGGALG